MREGWLGQDPVDPAPLRAVPTPSCWPPGQPVWPAPLGAAHPGAGLGGNHVEGEGLAPWDPCGSRYQGPPQVPRPSSRAADRRGTGEGVEPPPTFWQEGVFQQPQPEKKKKEPPKGTRQEVGESLGQQEAQAALLRQAEKRKRKQRAKKYRAQQAKAARARLERSPRTQPQQGRAQEKAYDLPESPPGPPTFGDHAPMGYGRRIVVRRGKT